jgi:hypothetical protein
LTMENAERDTAALDQYLADNCNGIDEGGFCEVFHDAKERGNPGDQPVCLEPDHISGDCDCDPTPLNVQRTIQNVFRDRSSRTAMFRVIHMTDGLGRSLQHGRLLQPF